MNGSVANIRATSIVGLINVTRDIHNAEQAIAKDIWKKTCGIYKKQEKE